MSVLCYNKGCGQRFDPENNLDGEWVLAMWLCSHLESSVCCNSAMCCTELSPSGFSIKVL